MSDEELKKIVEETIGNNDPYWNEPVLNIVKKIIEMPENTETSISKLVNGEYNNKAMFDINKTVTKIFEKLVIMLNGKRVRIILDKSKHAGQIIGLPYNISFVIKHMVLPDENKIDIELIKD